MTYQQAIKAVFAWPDRRRVFHQILDVPTPLLLSYLRVNYSQPNVFRLISLCEYGNDDVVKAVMAFGIKPHNITFKHPKKKKEEIIPREFSKRDKYWKIIVANDAKIANQIRDNNDELPRKMKKRKEKTTEWI